MANSIIAGNDFRLIIRAKKSTGAYLADMDLADVEDLRIYLTRAGRSKVLQSYTLDEEGHAVIYVSAGVVTNATYGIEMVGVYGGARLRAHNTSVFTISGHGGGNSGVLNDYYADIVFVINVAATDVYVQNAIEAHNEDDASHPHLLQLIEEAGDVDDVQIDGESIVDENKIAKIDSSQFGKVDDVKVNGTSVVSNKEANITIPEKVSDLPNDAEYATQSELTTGLAAKQDTITAVVEPTIADDGGNPSASVDFNDGEMAFAFKNLKLRFSDLTAADKAELKGDKGDQGDSAVYDPSSPDAPDFEMANATGQSTTKAMTQKAVTDAINNATTFKKELQGSISASKYINLTNDSVSYSETYDIYVFKVEKGALYDIYIEHSGPTVSWALNYGSSPSQTSGFTHTSGIINNNGEISLTQKEALDDYLFLCATKNTSAPVVTASVSVKEKINEIESSISDLAEELDNFPDDNFTDAITKDETEKVPVASAVHDFATYTKTEQINTATIRKNQFARYSDWVVQYSQTSNIAVYEVDVNKKYDIRIPKTYTAAVLAVGFGDNANPFSASERTKKAYGNSGEMILKDVIPDAEYLYIGYEFEYGLPEVTFTEYYTIKDLYNRVSEKDTLAVVDNYSVLVNERFNLYYDGIFSGLSLNGYDFGVKFNNGSYQGSHFSDFYEFEPTAKGSHSIKLSLYDSMGLVDSKDITLNVVSPNDLTSQQKVILMIGASELYPGNVTQEVYRKLCTSDTEHTTGSVFYPHGLGKGNFTFIGNKPTPNYNNVRFCGVGGWTADFYNKKSERYDTQWLTSEHDKDLNDQHSIYQDGSGRKWILESIESGRIYVYMIDGTYTTSLLTGSLTWVSGGEHHSNIVISSSSIAPGNPFWNEGEDKVDFANFAEQQGVDTIDYVLIFLGTNNMNDTDETIMETTQTLIDNIRTSFPDAIIRLMTSIKSSREGWYGTTTAYYEFVRHFVRIKRLYKQIKDNNTNLDVIDRAGMIDLERCTSWSYKVYNQRYVGSTPNYRTIFLNNAVHVNEAGHCMTADMIVADIVKTFSE